MTLLQSGLGFQMNYRSLLLQYLPNQTTNNESMKKGIKKLMKNKSSFDSEPLVPISYPWVAIILHSLVAYFRG